MAITKKEIVVKTDKDGNVSIEAFGFSDGECKKATKEIEEAVGGVQSRKMKDPHVEEKVGKTVKVK